MAYIKTVDNGTTIIVTCPDDTITFTIATANARLMEANPQRAWIQDDNGDWFIYPTMMFNYGTAQTGMAGNDYSRQVISGNWSWYPLASAENANASAITTSLQDTTMDDPSNGSWVVDLNMPDNIGVDGFSIDGAIHIEPSGGVAKFTFDRTRYNQPVVIHDAGFQTGTVASPTEHLVGHWKMDDNAASAVIAATVGTNGVLNGGNTTDNLSSSESIRGSSLQLDGTDDRMVFNVMGDLADDRKFTLLIKFKPTFGTAPASNKYIFNIGAAANDRLEFGFNGGGDNYFLYTRLAGGGSLNYNIEDGLLVSNALVNKWTTVLFAVDLTRSMCVLMYDGIIFYCPLSGTDWGGSPQLYIGCDEQQASRGDFYADELKLYDDAILPYGGGPLLTNDGSDYSNAHSDVTLFSDDGSSYDIGTNVIGDIDNSAGQLSFWVDPPSALSADETLFSAGTYFSVDWDHSDSDIVFTYGSGYTIRTTTAITAGLDGKHHIKVGWSASGQITMQVDGKAETPVSCSTAPTLGAGFTWSSNVGMTRKCITSNPNTTDNWSAMGAPRLMPLLEVID